MEGLIFGILRYATQSLMGHVTQYFKERLSYRKSAKEALK